MEPDLARLAPSLLASLVPGGDSPSTSAAPPAQAPPFEVVLQLARRHRVVPLVIEAVGEGRLDVTDEQLDRLLALEIETAGSQVMVESRLLEAHAALIAAGIESAVLKGVAVAHLDYPDPSLRQFGDADVLVPAERLRDAIAALSGLGWRPASALPAGHLEFTHAFPMRHPVGGDVDLHQALGRRSIGLKIPAREICSRTTTFELAGTALRALDAGDRLVHAVVHGGTSRGVFRRLSSTADVLVLAESPAVDPAVVVERAVRWRIVALLREVLLDAHATAGVALPHRWAEVLAEVERTGAGRDRLWEAAHLSPTRRAALEELAMLRDLSWGRRWRYVSGYLRTDEAYAARHGRRGVGDQARYLRGKLLGR